LRVFRVDTFTLHAFALLRSRLLLLSWFLGASVQEGLEVGTWALSNWVPFFRTSGTGRVVFCDLFHLLPFFTTTIAFVIIKRLGDSFYYSSLPRRSELAFTGLASYWGWKPTLWLCSKAAIGLPVGELLHTGIGAASGNTVMHLPVELRRRSSADILHGLGLYPCRIAELSPAFSSLRVRGHAV
jgi:hypothetical protein